MSTLQQSPTGAPHSSLLPNMLNQRDACTLSSQRREHAYLLHTTTQRKQAETAGSLPDGALTVSARAQFRKILIRWKTSHSHLARRTVPRGGRCSASASLPGPNTSGTWVVSSTRKGTCVAYPPGTMGLSPPAKNTPSTSGIMIMRKMKELFHQNPTRLDCTFHQI